MDSFGLLFGPPYHAFKNLQLQIICNSCYILHTYLIKTNASAISGEFYVMGKLNYVGCSSYAINSVNCSNINVDNCRDLFPHL